MKDLGRNLALFLKKHKNLFDVIIYGSYVTGKQNPKDIDICFILNEEDLELIETLRTETEQTVNYPLGFEFIFLKDLYQNPLWRSLEREGYSVKNKKFLKQLLGINSYFIFTYELSNLKKWEKVRVAQVMKVMLKKYGAEKLGLGAVMVPREHSGFFIEFLNRWKIDYKVKWIDMIQ